MATPQIPGTQPNKVHMWMLMLLGWTAVFSLISVGLLLSKGSSATLSTTDLRVACQNGTVNGITTNLTRISEACNTTSSEEIPAILAIMNAEGAPTFSYPVGWHFSVNKDLTGGKRTIRIYGHPTPIITGTETEGPFVLFHLVAGHKADMPMNTFPTATESTGNTVVKTLANGTLTTITNVTNDFTGELGEKIYFVGQTEAVEITLPNRNDKTSETILADLSVIIDSLDFSAIQ